MDTDLEQIIYRHTHAPAAPELRPASPTLTTRRHQWALARQARLNVALYGEAVR